MALTEVLQWHFVPYSYTKGLGSIRYLKSNVLYAVLRLQVGGKIFIYSAWNLAQAELALVGLNIIFQKLWRELNPHI